LATRIRRHSVKNLNNSVFALDVPQWNTSKLKVIPRSWFNSVVATIYTIGHSTRELNELVSALQAHGINTLVDIRAFPRSRRLPHFNRENLQRELPNVAIEYVWLQQLGGRRKRQSKDSPNIALRNDSFRNYADYMLTAEFADGIGQLAQISANGLTAIMCAERVYFHCHRMLVADYLTARGHEVLHIEDEKPARPHRLMPEARMVEGRLLYIGDRLFA
jgi:uncharacterized protein (DUF488 family)